MSSAYDDCAAPVKSSGAASRGHRMAFAEGMASIDELERRMIE
jgi:hypothetical protein